MRYDFHSGWHLLEHFNSGRKHHLAGCQGDRGPTTMYLARILKYAWIGLKNIFRKLGESRPIVISLLSNHKLFAMTRLKFWYYYRDMKLKLWTSRVSLIIVIIVITTQSYVTCCPVSISHFLSRFEIQFIVPNVILQQLSLDNNSSVCVVLFCVNRFCVEKMGMDYLFV